MLRNKTFQVKMVPDKEVEPYSQAPSIDPSEAILAVGVVLVAYVAADTVRQSWLHILKAVI